MDLMGLIDRCQTGDEEALAALFHQYKKLIYRTAFLTLGDAEEAEDARQEVFVRVLRSLASFSPSKGHSQPDCIASQGIAVSVGCENIFFPPSRSTRSRPARRASIEHRPCTLSRMRKQSDRRWANWVKGIELP